MDGKEYVYSDGTTTFPQPLPTLEHNYNYLGPGVRGTGLALAGLVFATAIFFALWSTRYRATRVVRASQPMFLHMIIAGTVLMAATIITLSFDDQVASQAGCDIACALNPWFITYGFVISFCKSIDPLCLCCRVYCFFLDMPSHTYSQPHTLHALSFF